MSLSGRNLPHRDAAPAEAGRALTFGAFRLEPAERLLTHDGQPVALTPKAFDLLVYLAERPGRLVRSRC